MQQVKKYNTNNKNKWQLFMKDGQKTQKKGQINQWKKYSGNNIQQLNQIKQKQETQQNYKLLMEMVQNPKTGSVNKNQINSGHLMQQLEKYNTKARNNKT